MQNLIEDILYDRRTDKATLLLRAFLRILESGYSAITSIRNFMYNKNIFKTRNVPCRVISIGNLTVGGTGKTPTVVMTAKMLIKAGYTLAVISRGYRGKTKTPMIVSDGSEIKASSVETGDEARIIAHELPGVPVVVSKNRYRGARLAYERFRPRIILLDDAFQHRRLFRNVDILTMDAENPLGNEHLLPRGILRESPFEIKRAHAVIITRFRDELKKDMLERTVRHHNRNVPVFWSRHVPSGLRKPGSMDRISLDIVRGKKIAALSNIVNPHSFHRMLESLESEIVYKKIMPDHYRYSSQELESIENDACDAGSEILVMTAKDERNLPEYPSVETIETLVLDIKAVLIEDEDKYFEIIKPSAELRT